MKSMLRIAIVCIFMYGAFSTPINHKNKMGMAPDKDYRYSCNMLEFYNATTDGIDLVPYFNKNYKMGLGDRGVTCKKILWSPEYEKNVYNKAASEERSNEHKSSIVKKVQEYFNKNLQSQLKARSMEVENHINNIKLGGSNAYNEEMDDSSITTDSINLATFDYKATKVNGINLGGWLVTEPFITPSLYEAASVGGTEASTPVDEYHYCKSLGFTEAQFRLKKHWDTWITEADMAKIKDYGFNSVRLPIGYWAFARLKNDPYVFGQEEYLQKAIQWCRKYGLTLLIDLHGIPGSQNGFDNSGQRNVYDWMKEDNVNYQLGIQVLQYIFDKYGGPEYNDVVIGYQNLNEPLVGAYPMEKILRFDEITYDMFRKRNSNNWFVIHDVFIDPLYWKAQMTEPQFDRIVLDHHRYEVFHSNQLREAIDGHITSLRTIVNQFLQIPRVQIVGEWSAALTDCAKWLNGVGRGARFNNTFGGDGFIGQCSYSNNVTAMTEKNREETRRIIEAQLDLYNQTNGFYFWTYKTENAIEWSMTALADEGLFPLPLSDRKYPRVV